MTIVRTVLGDVAPDDLGPTYLHEHLIIDSPLVADRLPHIHLPSVDDAVAELASCTVAGLGAVVDAMPAASGRHAPRLAEISRRSGVHVVATTGLHTAKYYDGKPWVASEPSGVLAELFIADIVEGIDRYDYTGPVVRRTTHRAGTVKLATSGGIVDDRLFEAVAATYHRTGAPVITHCEDGQGGHEQVATLTRLGVPAGRIALSHTDKVVDPGYHRDLLATGVNLEYDQGLRQAVDESKGTAWLMSLMLEDGFGGQLMLGTDGARRSLWTTLGGGPGLAWLLTGFADVLARWGVDESARRQILVTNPARFLSFDTLR